MGHFQSSSCEYHCDDVIAKSARAWLRGKIPRSECGYYAGAEVDQERMPTGVNEEI